MEKIKKYIFIEGLFLIAVILIGGILFFTGPIPIKNNFIFYSNLILKIEKLNKNITLVKSRVNKILYYSALKKLPQKYSQFQKTRLKKALNNLKLSLKRTDKQYKELDGFIKKNGVFLKHDRQTASYFNKSYFNWKNISEPILKIIIKYRRYRTFKILHQLFLKYIFYDSHIPISNIIKDRQSHFKKVISIAIYEFIAAVLTVIFFAILFFRYFNKFQETLLNS
ncbi:MAG: hypothetical protein ACYCUW_07260, partial [bacterium]